MLDEPPPENRVSVLNGSAALLDPLVPSLRTAAKVHLAVMQHLVKVQHERAEISEQFLKLAEEHIRVTQAYFALLGAAEAERQRMAALGQGLAGLAKRKTLET